MSLIRIRRVKRIKQFDRGVSLLFVMITLLGTFIWADKTDYWADSSSEPSNYQQFMGCIVERVQDGDSLIARCQQQLLKLRLWGIDAPEMGQVPFGRHARDFLQRLLEQDEFTVKLQEKDRYGRWVARIDKNQHNIELQMLKAGHAVLYSRYNRELEYAQAQTYAQQHKLGVWSVAGHQQNPEAWRRLNPR